MQDCENVMAMGGVGNVTNRGTFGFFLVFYTFGSKATPLKPSSLNPKSQISVSFLDNNDLLKYSVGVFDQKRGII